MNTSKQIIRIHDLMGLRETWLFTPSATTWVILGRHHGFGSARNKFISCILHTFSFINCGMNTGRQQMYSSDLITSIYENMSRQWQQTLYKHKHESGSYWQLIWYLLPCLVPGKVPVVLMWWVNYNLLVFNSHHCSNLCSFSAMFEWWGHDLTGRLLC
jgi:hypothetical protein